MTDKQEERPEKEPVDAPESEQKGSLDKARVTAKPVAEEPEVVAEQVSEESEPTPEATEAVADLVSDEPESEHEADSAERKERLNAAQKDIASAKHHMRYNRRKVAREHLEHALSIWTELNDQSGIANATFELGILSSLQADYGLAQRHYQQALAIWQELDDHVGQAQVLIQIGHVFYCLGDNAQAQAHYAKAHERSALTDKPV